MDQADPGKTVLLTTGGTIGTDQDYSSRLTGAQLLAQVPVFGASPDLVELDEADNRPSPAFEPSELMALALRARAHLAREDVSGLVMTFGTDALDELIYLLYLVVDGPKPLVVTAAMYHSGTRLADGPRNLYHSILAARTPAVGHNGAVLVFGDMIHSGREVIKVSSTRAEAFASPKYGPLGSVEHGRILLHRRHIREPQLTVSDLEPNVGLIAASLGVGGEVVDAYLAAGARGLVVSTMGGGALPPRLGERLRRLAVEEGFPVVAATRCIQGSVPRSARLPEVLTAGDLPPHKARIKLMLGLAETRDLPPAAARARLTEIFHGNDTGKAPL